MLHLLANENRELKLNDKKLIGGHGEPNSGWKKNEETDKQCY